VNNNNNKNRFWIFTSRSSQAGKYYLLLLEALQLQGRFGLLNEFFPFGPVSVAVPPVCYFHICYVTFYIILPPIFRSSYLAMFIFLIGEEVNNVSFELLNS